MQRRLAVQLTSKKALKKGKRYTVVGIYHQDIEKGTYGNSWCWWVRAPNPQAASVAAKALIGKEHGYDLSEMSTVAVFKGHRKDLFDCPVDE
jgi:hypothetical protein